MAKGFKVPIMRRTTFHFTRKKPLKGRQRFHLQTFGDYPPQGIFFFFVQGNKAQSNLKKFGFPSPYLNPLGENRWGAPPLIEKWANSILLAPSCANFWCQTEGFPLGGKMDYQQYAIWG